MATPSVIATSSKQCMTQNMSKPTPKNTVLKVENGGPTVAKTMVLDKYPIVLRVVVGVPYIFILRKIHKFALCLAGVKIGTKGWEATRGSFGSWIPRG